MKTVMMWSAAGLAATLLAGSAGAKDLTGSGSTAIYPVLSKWADAYRSSTGITVNYQPLGSGRGIDQIAAKIVDFAASDKPLLHKDLTKMDAVQFPLAIISIVPVINLQGVKPGEMVLSGTVLADIYLGKITSWDDWAIKSLNPSMMLPHSVITTVHRSDGSGTTFIFTNYLDNVSVEWDQKVGADLSVDWPNGVPGKGNDGVASATQRVNGSIGYVEYAYALENHMTYTKMVNASGKTVDATMETFAAGAASADFSSVPDFYLVPTNQPGDRTWPMTGVTWGLMRTDYPAEQNEALLKFFDWCLKNEQAQSQAKTLAYVPLPPNVISQIETSWMQEFKSQDGKPIWTAAAR